MTLEPAKLLQFFLREPGKLISVLGFYISLSEKAISRRDLAFPNWQKLFLSWDFSFPIGKCDLPVRILPFPIRNTVSLLKFRSSQSGNAVALFRFQISESGKVICAFGFHAPRSGKAVTVLGIRISGLREAISVLGFHIFRSEEAIPVFEIRTRVAGKAISGPGLALHDRQEPPGRATG